MSRAQNGGGPHHLSLDRDSLLTFEQEQSLGAAAHGGDRTARDRLVKANLRLVMRIAREFQGRGLDYDDLVGEGNLGLIRAAVEYDPSFGTRFSTYASYWIKQAIRHALINTAATIRLPAHTVQLLTRWRRAERALTRRLSRAPTGDEVAEHAGITGDHRKLVEKALRTRHLQAEGDTGMDGWSAAEIPAEAVPPQQDMEAREERQVLHQRLEQLGARERAILRLRFGLSGESGTTLKETGRRLGVTREWVRKLELRALAELADSEASHPGEAALREAMRRKKWDRAAPSWDQVIELAESLISRPGGAHRPQQNR